MDPKKQPMNKPEKEPFTRKAGDKIERMGEKVSKAGLPKTGKAIYDAGNKIEHSKD
jgi:hypothetical protein